MTSRAAITQAELKRIAAVARSENVIVEIEIDGRKIRVTPAIPDNHKPEPIDKEDDILL